MKRLLPLLFTLLTIPAFAQTYDTIPTQIDGRIIYRIDKVVIRIDTVFGEKRTAIDTLFSRLNPIPEDPKPPPVGSDRLGLNHTSEELEIWRKRANNGPYKSFGDAQVNSPGDWDRIVSQTKKFMLNPQAERFAMFNDGSCVIGGPTQRKYAPVGRHEDMLCAAFYALLKEDPKIAQIVIAEIAWHSQQPSLDFTNSKIWCHPSQGSDDDANPFFETNYWLLRLLHTYDFVKDYATDNQKILIEKWLYNAASYWSRNLDYILSESFVNGDRVRGAVKDEFLQFGPPGRRPPDPGTITHYGGYEILRINKSRNNRKAEFAQFVGIAGVFFRDKEMIDNAKVYYQNWLKYCVYPDGTMGEMQRWTTSTGGHEQGYAYAASCLNSAINFADALARSGDNSMYEYTTSEGAGQSVGGKKNILLVMQAYCKYKGLFWKRYATNQASNVGNENYLIEGIRKGGNGDHILEWIVAKANVYYRDELVRSVYTRQCQNCSPYPATNEILPTNQVMQHGKLPASLFMYGQMEGKVWPYPAVN